MALIIADRVKETTITSGVGTLTLSGSTFGGFQTFAEAIGDGNTTYYCIQNEGQFEIGIGTYTSSGNTLSRDTVFQSSNSDNKINISGVGLVFCVVPADKLVYKDGDDSVVFPTPFVFKRSDDGDYWQALSTDYTNRVASFYIEEGTDPTWKIGLKTSNSEIIAPYYAYVSGKDGFVELRGNASSILSIGDEDAQGLQVNHQLKNIIDIRKNGGEIAIQNLDLNSDETTSAKNNSIAYTVFAVESSAGHAADLQTWSVATDEKASLNQYGDFETAGDIIAPSGRFTAIRFSDGSTQTTAALPFASGALIDQNTTNIVTQSGYFQSVIDSIDSASVSGWAESYIDQTSGNLQSQIDINESNISTVSGLIGDADFLPGASGGLIDQNSQDILTVSGLLYDDSAVSGYFESRVDSADSAINTVSGLLTPSGESFNFAGNLLTYNNSDGGSFTADLSSLSTFDTSGVSLAYSAGTLTYTNNAGGSFDVDISSISGDVYALIVDGAPTTLDTLNEIAAALNDDENIANTLTTLISTTSGNLQSQITSNDGDITQLNSDITTVSGLLYDDSAISGYFESRVDQADTDIATVSGLLYDDSAISGYFESRVDQADTDIATVSGLLYDDSAISGYFESRVDQADTDIATVSGLLYDDAAISGYFESRVDQTDADIVTVSGLLYDDAAISGYFESRVDQADADIVTVSGLLDSVTPTGTPSGVGFFDNTGSLSGNSSFTYDGANVRLFGNIDVSGISTFGSGIKTYLRTEADATTITFDMDQSNNYTAELGGNRTLAVSNVDAGQKFTIRLTQDATGSRVPTWWSGITWLTSDGSDPTLKTGSGEIDYFGFISTSGGYYEGFHLTEAGGGGGGGSSTITVKEADGTPNVSNVSTIVVSNGTLTNDGGGQVTITTGGGGGGSYDDTYISGVSTFASGLAIQNQADIATVSGLLYDDTAISGYFESRVDQADSDIATVSGLLYDDTAISGYFESRVNTNETQITAVSGWAQSYVDSQDHSAAAVSGALQSQITSNDADIAYLSGIAVYGSGQTLQSVTDNGATTSNAIVINSTLEAETVLADIDGPIILECKNNTGSTINAGTPVYVSGYFSANGKALIAPAVGNDPTKMPAIGLVADNLTTGTEGHVHVFGLATGFDTSTFTVGQTVYVDPTASGLTNVRPTGINELVQNMGRVLRSDATQGRVLLLGPGRTNDVPNSGAFEILSATTGNFEHMNLTSDDSIPTFTFTGSGVNDTPINLEVRSSLMSATGSGTALLFQGTQGQLFSITDNLSSGTIFNVSDITGLPMLEVTASGDVEIGEFADNITIHQPVLISGGVPSGTTNKLYNNNGSLYFNGSALGYDDTYISGVATFASGLAVTNETNITANSGYFEDNILELVGVSGIDVTSAGSTVNISAGSLSGYFENHHITTAATASSNNSGRTYIQDVLLDSYGHVTGIATAVETVTDTDTTYTAGTGLSLVGTTFNLDFSSAAIVTEAEGISSNDNDTTLPTSAAVKDYVDNNAGSSYTAGSGLTLVGSEFNVYGGSGNFEYIELTTDNTVVPKIEFTGSGVTDTPIRMKVLSSHASASTSGTALSFEGTQGQLFGITDNLSSGTIFSVNDITGLPMIEVDASGDVKVGRFANSVVLYSPSVNGSVQGDLDVTGAFSATTKSFLIDHPSKEGMKLQYASLEGPENGVYVRGTTDSGTITLPDYWRDLVHNGSITVTLTPVGQFQPLFVEQKSNREIRVGGVCGYYDYVVYGERKDVDKLEVEW